ncbi:MAG: hypothetical protein EPO24_05255 [Bacteroidetes bacterium]|nr:MAG: hypothetical protein EPO24_05255 [Bacteroidota bacterium]
MYKIITILVLVLMLASCSDDGLIRIFQHSLIFPNAVPSINRSLLVSGSTYTPGYTNGNIRSNKVTITWQTSSDAGFLAYKIFRNNSLVKIITDVSIGTYTDTTLNQNSYYKYMVATQLGEGTHQMDTVTIKTPRFLAPTLSYQISPPKSIILQWNESAETATRYTLERSLNNSLFTVIATPSVRTYTDTNVANGNYYYYRIRAVGTYESTPVSQSYSVYFQYTMNAPSLASLTQQSSTRMVRLNWTDNSTGESVFRIYRRSSSSNFTLIDSVGTNETTYLDDDTTYLKFDSTYYYYVKGYNQVDTTARSNTRGITIVQQLSSLNEMFESGTIPANWSTGGSASWNVTNVAPYSGSYSARSGVIGHNQTSYLQTTVSFTGTKTISFYYKVSSEGCCDALRFYINGTLYQSFAGEVGWALYSTSYSGSGTVVLRWEYTKDGSVTTGQDAAWIDDVLVQ